MPRKIRWAPGYSAHQLANIQSRFDLRFPPDLIDLYSRKRPVDAYDWLTDIDQIKSMLDWPLEGLVFDVENNALWLNDWGERPDTAGARRQIVAEQVRAAPKLIPLVGHRFLPATPHKSGNPVLSVYQSDIIIYGVDLEDFFEAEFGSQDRPACTKPIRRIPFWSRFVDGDF